jgi:hypothetical protein
VFPGAVPCREISPVQQNHAKLPSMPRDRAEIWIPGRDVMLRSSTRAAEPCRVTIFAEQVHAEGRRVPGRGRMPKTIIPGRGLSVLPSYEGHSIGQDLHGSSRRNPSTPLTELIKIQEEVYPCSHGGTRALHQLRLATIYLLATSNSM